MIAGWWQGRMVAYDCETTGTDVETDRIVTAAIAVVGGGLATETMDVLVDPGIEIPAGATAVHGVTTERARTEGLPAADAVTGILIALETHLQPGRPLIIQNAPFDLTILDREARRHGLVPLQERVDLRVVDPLVLDKHLDRYRRGSRKLEAVCAHHGATLAGAHDAGHDAIAAARLAWCIGARGHVIRQARGPRERDELAALETEWSRVHNDLDALVGAQKRWAAEQADGLADYFRRQGNHEAADGVRREWPIAAWGDVVGEAA